MLPEGVKQQLGSRECRVGQKAGEDGSHFGVPSLCTWFGERDTGINRLLSVPLPHMNKDIVYDRSIGEIEDLFKAENSTQLIQWIDACLFLSIKWGCIQNTSF